MIEIYLKLDWVVKWDDQCIVYFVFYFFEYSNMTS